MSGEAPTDVLERQPALPRAWRASVIGGPDVGSSVNITGTVTVGKDSNCSLTLTDSAVSQRHVELSVAEGQGLRVRDLGSTNGTYYLDTAIGEVVVPAGAVLRLGNTTLAITEPPVVASAETPSRGEYGALVGSSPTIQRLYGMLERLEKNTDPVLIVGETGCGKDLIAQEIHRHSARKSGPFEVFDCGSATETLLQSALFGHVRGAFTGAERDQMGVFERAAGGTVFLDEIGELPMALQSSFLRVLETGTVQPLGSGSFKAADFRLIAATNRDLQKSVDEGRFRSDLYYRLNVMEIVAPPLRDRPTDIPILIRHFLDQAGKSSVELSPSTVEMFTSGYDWPGNVRELRNAVLRVVNLGVAPPALEKAVSQAETEPSPQGVDTSEPFREARAKLLGAFERDYVASQLKQSEGNISEAARASGMDRAYFRRLAVKHGLLD